MLDDHIPFLEAGIPAADLIDFDYPYWHTVEDTPDKVSAQSLKAVGETLLAWVNTYGSCLAQGNYTQANCNAP
jgi:Zn-dependent M28 family amino/carboxypeptidase